MFWHILTKLAYYRELTLRIDQLAAKGLLDPAALAAAASSGVVRHQGRLWGLSCMQVDLWHYITSFQP